MSANVTPRSILSWALSGEAPYEQAGHILERLERQGWTVAPIPKPPEPGKYGVVVAGDGREWFRYTIAEREAYDWCRPSANGATEYARWDDLDVLRVIREGVQ